MRITIDFFPRSFFWFYDTIEISWKMFREIQVEYTYSI